MNKITVNWEEIPEQYKYVAIDDYAKNGKWSAWAFEKKPVFDKGASAWNNSDNSFDFIIVFPHQIIAEEITDYSQAIISRYPTIVHLPALLEEYTDDLGYLPDNKLINEGLNKAVEALEKQGYQVEFTKE